MFNDHSRSEDDSNNSCRKFIKIQIYSFAYSTPKLKNNNLTRWLPEPFWRPCQYYQARVNSDKRLPTICQLEFSSRAASAKPELTRASGLANLPSPSYLGIDLLISMHNYNDVGTVLIAFFVECSKIIPLLFFFHQFIWWPPTRTWKIIRVRV